MSNMLVNSSFEQPLEERPGWNTSGQVFREPLLAFERQWLAALNGTKDVVNGYMSVISQNVRIPEEVTILRLVYALRPGADGMYQSIDGRFQVRIQWFGSAGDGLPILREDVLEIVDETNMVEQGWWTRVLTTDPKPEGARWARVRFVHGVRSGAGSVYIDQVIVTPEYDPANRDT